MNVVIFITHRNRRPQYLALCQCGARHGPYAKVAQIPPRCFACERQAPTTDLEVLHGLTRTVPCE
jgi:hypothetical protein